MTVCSSFTFCIWKYYWLTCNGSNGEQWWKLRSQATACHRYTCQVQDSFLRRSTGWYSGGTFFSNPFDAWTGPSEDTRSKLCYWSPAVSADAHVLINAVSRERFSAIQLHLSCIQDKNTFCHPWAAQRPDVLERVSRMSLSLISGVDSTSFYAQHNKS